MMNFLRQIIFYSYHDLWHHDGLHKCYVELEKNQWQHEDLLKLLQRKKLGALLKYCNKHVPYYRSLFSKMKLSEEEFYKEKILSRLPILTKSTIRENYPQLIADQLSGHDIVKSSTSGSTGESLFFNMDKKSAVQRKAVTFRFYGWCGIRPFDRQATLWGARFDAPSHESVSDKLRTLIRPLLFLSSYELDERTMEEYVNKIKEFKPKLLTSYPSPLERLAVYCLSRNVRLSSLKAIICSAEQLFDYQRELIERAFGVNVFNRYGSREFGNIAQECNIHKGMHIATEHVIVEVLREDGSPCDEKETGELVITDLDNYAMPFIRYKIEDMGALSSKECSCGRGLPIIENIEGRVFDLICTPSGKTISGTFWTLLLRYISEKIIRFQVIQDRLDRISLLLQMGQNRLTDEQEKLLRNKIAELAPDLKVDIEYVNNISLTATGKSRFVINKMLKKNA
jgi:phenylacetate-CoA ligase